MLVAGGIGAGAGAVTAKLVDVGVTDEFVAQLREMVAAGHDDRRHPRRPRRHRGRAGRAAPLRGRPLRRRQPAARGIQAVRDALGDPAATTGGDFPPARRARRRLLTAVRGQKWPRNQVRTQSRRAATGVLTVVRGQKWHRNRVRTGAAPELTRGGALVESGVVGEDSTGAGRALDRRAAALVGDARRRGGLHRVRAHDGLPPRRAPFADPAGRIGVRRDDHLDLRQPVAVQRPRRPRRLSARPGALPRPRRRRRVRRGLPPDGRRGSTPRAS